jgi:hypothetical protein
MIHAILQMAQLAATGLESLLQPRADAPQMRIYFAYSTRSVFIAMHSYIVRTWRRSQNQRDNSVSCDLDVLHRTENMNMPETTPKRISTRTADSRNRNVRISQDYTCSTGIFDRKLCLSVLPRDSTDSSRQMITVERLDVLDLKGIQVKVFETEDGECVLRDGMSGLL